MQVAHLDDVAIDEGQAAHTPANEGLGECGAERTRPHQENAGRAKTPLPLASDPGEGFLARISAPLRQMGLPSAAERAAASITSAGAISAGPGLELPHRLGHEHAQTVDGGAALLVGGA